MRDGYHAIELYDASMGHRFNMTYCEHDLMSSWDCESIVVLDPSKIKIIEG